jgi:hypothetical protein
MTEKQEDINYEKLIKSLSDEELQEWEELGKSCPRCGKASANKSNPSGRCSACLKKLAANKKKVGRYEHYHKLADDSLRRQKGKNGTASKKSKGLGTRKGIIDKMKRAEKKTGQVLSPDRKDNSKGYSDDNVRAVPKNLNRGRHKVDPKKLKRWKESLKKYNITDEEFNLLLLVKAEELAKTDENVAQIFEALIKVLEEQ